MLGGVRRCGGASYRGNVDQRESDPPFKIAVAVGLLILGHQGLNGTEFMNAMTGQFANAMTARAILARSIRGGRPVRATDGGFVPVGEVAMGTVECYATRFTCTGVLIGCSDSGIENIARREARRRRARIARVVISSLMAADPISKPTLVLIHGGSVTSTAWDPLLMHLRFPVLTLDLPGRRYSPADLGTIHRSDWECAVANEVRLSGAEHVILIGHSSGGYVIPGAAALLGPQIVSGLIYVASTCPAESQAPADALAPKLAALTLGNEQNLRSQSGGKTLGGLRPGEAPIRTELEVVELVGSMGLEAPLQLFEPMTWIGVPDLPRLYVRALQDRVIPPDHALIMAANANVTEIVDIESKHDVAGDAPLELASIINSFATRFA